MRLLLKRDETGSSHPSPDQLEVGELVINSVTGKLYSKLKDGTVVEWGSQKICFDPTPDINTYYENTISSNDIVNEFCCLGGILELEVLKLRDEPEEYSFEFVELTTNSNPEDIEVQPPQYSKYTIPKPNTTTNETITVRKAIVPINLSIVNKQQEVSIFKFTVLSVTQKNKKLIEKIITVKCKTETE